MDPTADLTWLQIATSLGFGGLAWYLIIIAGPRELGKWRDEFGVERAAREAQLRAYMESLALQRADFSRELAATRTAHDQNIERVAKGYEQQMNEHRKTVGEMVSRFTNALPPKPEKGKT